MLKLLLAALACYAVLVLVIYLMQARMLYLADVPGRDDGLAPDEAADLAGLRFSKRRAEWRLGRWTAKRALSAQSPEHAPALTSIAIRAAEDGAPEVFIQGRPAPCTISISHRADRALCMVAGAAVALGCDLEMVEPRSPAFVSDYFAPEERVLVQQAPETARP